MRRCFPKTSRGEFHACTRLSLYNLAEMFGVLYKLSRGLDVMLVTGCFLLAFLLVLPQIITTVKLRSPSRLILLIPFCWTVHFLPESLKPVQ